MITPQEIDSLRRLYDEANFTEAASPAMRAWINAFHDHAPEILSAARTGAMTCRAGGERVRSGADLEEAIRLCEVGEYLYSARAYSYGDGYTEPREYGIDWQWQQSKPGEYGQGVLLAEAVKWHEEQAADGFVTEAAKLRAALRQAAQPSDGEPIGYIPQNAMNWLREGRNATSVNICKTHGWPCTEPIYTTPASPAQVGAQPAGRVIPWEPIATSPTDGSRIWVSDGETVWQVTAWRDGTLHHGSATSCKFWCPDIYTPTPPASGAVDDGGKNA